MTSEIEVQTQVGLLRRTGEMNGFITAKCACGYPCVIAPQDWGSIYGCSKCHDAEAQRQQEDQERADRMARAEARDKREAAQAKKWWTDPHYDELSPGLRRLFKSLVDTPSFTVDAIASLTKTSRDYAWKILKDLISANVLVELVGYLGSYRPYSDRPYEAGASSASFYKVRGAAVRQMRELEDLARNAPEPVAEPRPEPTYGSGDVFGDDVKGFIGARCIVGSGEAESEIVLRSRFVSYMESIKQSAMLPSEFTETLGRLGYEVSDGKVRGLRLKKAKET
jgi:hypothetical protein